VNRLAEKSIVLTGATAGIGLSTARRLHEEGALLTLVARGERAGAELVAELGEERAQFVRADVAAPESARRIVAAARERFGRVDVLVNNAGVDFNDSLLDVDLDAVRGVFDVNFWGAFALLQGAGRAMREQGGGGAVVNVTSRLASIGVPGMSCYGASKGALLTLTRGAAVELAPFGIRVNAVAPGLTETPLYEEFVATTPDGPAVAEAQRAAIPQGRFGRPEEVAATIAFLAADEAAHITGASIPIDGGYTAT